jgi:ABC-type uncharacterized transport system permease subunit
MAWLSPVIAIVATLASGFVLFWLLGKDPARALYVFFVQPLTDLNGLAELGVKATPLALIGVGLAMGFRANVWNIGAEGQLTMGAIVAGGVAIHVADDTGGWLLPVLLLLGIAGGMAWSAIPALLRTRFNANEILTSLMLTYVALLLLSYLVHGSWRDPQGYNFPESKLFPDAGTLPVIVEGTRLHMGALLTLAVVAAGWVLLTRTVVGFQLKVVGAAPLAARYAGISQPRMVWFCLLLSGGLAGLAGLLEVAGPIGQLLPSVSPGYGFTAIIVAFLGRLNPFGVLLAALVMALTYLGGELAQIELGTPAAVTGLFQGILLFYLLASDVLIHYRVRWGRRPAVQEGRG